MARAGIENALWDIEAQQKYLPLAKLLGGTQSEIKCGVSLGLQATPEVLLEKSPSNYAPAISGSN